MAYNPKGLSVLAYANGFTLWHYRTDDTLETVMRLPRKNDAGEWSPGYFDAAADMLRQGDTIIANLTHENGDVTTHLLCVMRVEDESHVYIVRPC